MQQVPCKISRLTILIKNYLKSSYGENLNNWYFRALQAQKGQPFWASICFRWTDLHAALGIQILQYRVIWGKLLTWKRFIVGQLQIMLQQSYPRARRMEIQCLPELYLHEYDDAVLPGFTADEQADLLDFLCAMCILGCVKSIYHLHNCTFQIVNVCILINKNNNKCSSQLPIVSNCIESGANFMKCSLLMQGWCHQNSHYQQFVPLAKL